MKKFYWLLLFCFPILLTAQKRDYYLLQQYQFGNALQEGVLDNYLSNAFIPALNRQKISTVGVFTAIENDTAAVKRLFVLIPLSSIASIEQFQEKLNKDKAYLEAGAEFLNAGYKTPAFNRLEQIILKAFDKALKVQKPTLKGPVPERIYELRSYESSSQAIFQNKVRMFNEGDEVGIFKQLGFNAVFYGEVLAGPKMPNLMYMTSFENMDDRNAHWKSFGADPAWKKLSAMPEYQNNVSHIDIRFLKPKPYSQL